MQAEEQRSPKLGNMERRNFLKLSPISGAVTALQSCGSPEQQLIPFIPDRVMEGDAEIVRKGRSGLFKMGLAEKIEGNPDHPVNGGKLCARGHAALQVLYHPDRLANPLNRRGARSSADFQKISWEDALAELTAHLTEIRSLRNPAPLDFLTRPHRARYGSWPLQLLARIGDELGRRRSPMKRLVIITSVLFLSLAHARMLAAQTLKASANDPSLGTWALNVSRSKFASPPPKSFVERYDLRPDGYFVSTRSIVNNDGSPAFQQAVFKYDGKDYALFDNSSMAEFLVSGKRSALTLSAKAIDSYTVEYAVKQAGRVTTSGKRTVSKDGKTMTFSAKDGVAVFEKQ
jgi:hypothetical protein